MSVSSKKRKRKEAWEESLGGPLPVIEVDDAHEGRWLVWLYHVAPFEVRVEINLMDNQDHPWLYVNERNQQLVCEDIDDEQSRIKAEAQYGAMTRIRLLQQYQPAILEDEETGLAKLKEAATQLGLYGTRERRHCVIPTWTTH